MAHEVFMGEACFQNLEGTHEDLTQARVVAQWGRWFGRDNVLLPDTYGTLQFLKQVPKAKDWAGFRHDSGDPIIFGETIINYYKSLGINPLTKTIGFSDDLKLDKIIELYSKFHERINVQFGWGTNLTNDCGVKPLQMVVKLVECNGRPAVKLSDDPAKSTGDPAEIEKYRRIFKDSTSHP